MFFFTGGGLEALTSSYREKRDLNCLTGPGKKAVFEQKDPNLTFPPVNSLEQNQTETFD